MLRGAATARCERSLPRDLTCQKCLQLPGPRAPLPDPHPSPLLAYNTAAPVVPSHQQSLAPEWAKAATMTKAYDASILVAKLDATAEKEAAGKHEVKGFPTIKWFVDGQFVADYSGGRTAADIFQWIKKKTGPPSTAVDTVEAFNEARAGSNIVILGYFESFDGIEHAIFEGYAKSSDDVVCIKTTSAEVAAAMGLVAPGYAVGRAFEGFEFEIVPSTGHPTFNGDLNPIEALNAFVKAERLPAFIEFSQATAKYIFDSGIDNQVLVVAPSAMLAPGSPLVAELTAAGKELRGKVTVVTSRLDADPKGNPIVDYFGMDKESTKPQIVGFFAPKGTKYSGGKVEPVASEIVAFAKAVVAGTADKMFKSAPIPADPLDLGVTVVVGNTVDTIVKDPTKDVLLEVYAPWCGHCKTLKPIYEKLAKRFKTVPSITIAKMDGTENEHPEIESQGFPTLMLFPAEDGAAPIPYSGDRSLKDLTKFLKEHATIAFELPKKGKESKEEESKEEVPVKDEL
jgi:protein disulfide-isomerase A1